MKQHGPTLYVWILLLTLAFLGQAKGSDHLSTNTNNKGLFIIQFSWNRESYSNKQLVTVHYKKKASLTKATESAFVGKNNFLALELKDGEYEIKDIDLTGGDIPAGKRLTLKIDQPFRISAGQVTNGGIFFLTKENKDAKEVLFLHIDNTVDVKRYVGAYKTEYGYQLDQITPVWKYLDDGIMDKMVELYANKLVARENLKPRPNLKYMYTTLGMVIQMTRDEEGKVTEHKVITSPTFQQISKVNIREGKLFCTLSNGDFLFGDDQGLEYVPLPEGLQSQPSVYFFGTNQFLLVDYELNLFTSDDTFAWKGQTEFRRAQPIIPTLPKAYFGPRNMYIYTDGGGANKRVLRSPYEDIRFESVMLSKDVRKVGMVTETETKLILGPDLRSSVKKPALLYVQTVSNDTWEIVELPRGDCNTFSPYKDDENHFYTKCWKEDHEFQSFDGGNTWEAINRKKQ